MSEPEEMDGGLREAFRPNETSTGESALQAIQRLHGVGSNILLRDQDSADSELLLNHAGASARKEGSRYHTRGEIARGGIGIVYKCLDKDLNRDVAVKVLRPDYAERIDVIQRFIEEAQVGGQLQHPGIVPVYGIDVQADGRPSFAMKLIKGQTLAELLVDNPNGIDLRNVFEQVAQTMAYAHSRGVIHRDLKPANIMIGSFGEVQVVDWGFAKLLGRDEVVPDIPERTMIATVRSATEGSQSVAGSVMGTPAYMPPEQALGQVEELDERADVFALGAILSEILTGRPPYVGEPVDQLVAATQCDTRAALEQLAATDVEEELKDLVRDCLSAAREDRPDSAQVVAQRFTALRASAEERSRQSELDAIEAERESDLQRDRRRRTLLLASTVLLVLVGAGAALLWWRADRDARWAQAAPRVATALREANEAEGRRDWPAAVAAATRGVELARNAGTDASEAEAILARVRQEKEAADDEERRAAEDAAFLYELDTIRLRRARGTEMPGKVAAAYELAFKTRFGSLEGAKPRLHGSRHKAAFVTHLDVWAALVRGENGDVATLTGLADGLAPDESDGRRALLGEPADRAEFLAAHREKLSRAAGSLFGDALLADGKVEDAVSLLEQQVTRETADFWTHIALSNAARHAKNFELSLRHATAAIACRPAHHEAWELLADAQAKVGDEEGQQIARSRAKELAQSHGEAK